jgi:hypothetical protein
MVEVTVIGDIDVVWDTESVATGVVVGEHLFKAFIPVDINESKVDVKSSGCTDSLGEHDRVGLEVR